MNMMTLGELAAVLGAPEPADGTRPVGPDVCIDSRKAIPGSLFVAFVGEQVDGHDYIAAAAAKGAAATVCQRIPEGLPDPVAAGCLVVDDPTRAIGRLGRHVVDTLRNRSAGDGRPSLTVLGVTGSQGKTSTKDLLAQVLEQAGPTVAPEGSFNNEIGVPLTATRCTDATRFLVSEMGARGRGHIEYLCSLTPPQIGIELNVGVAHLGEFGSREAIAEAKGELVAALPDDGWAILNAADPRVLGMRERTGARIGLFCSDARQQPTAHLHVWAEDVIANELDQCSFTLVVEAERRTQRHPVTLQLSGRHQVSNATAAAAAAVAAGVDAGQVAAALSVAGGRSRWRMEVTMRPDLVTVVNDAYNANPDSMEAAIQTLASMAAVKSRSHPNLKTWAVLGQMRELGATSAQQHHELGQRVAEAHIDNLLALGENAPDMVRGARASGCKNAREVATIDETIAMLSDELGAGDIVLVKASRALALERVAEALVAETGTLSPAPERRNSAERNRA